MATKFSMDEEKEREKETPHQSKHGAGRVREKLESEGFDSDEFDENEREELADLL